MLLENPKAPLPATPHVDNENHLPRPKDDKLPKTHPTPLHHHLQQQQAGMKRSLVQAQLGGSGTPATLPATAAAAVLKKTDGGKGQQRVTKKPKVQVYQAPEDQEEQQQQQQEEEEREEKEKEQQEGKGAREGEAPARQEAQAKKNEEGMPSQTTEAAPYNPHTGATTEPHTDAHTDSQKPPVPSSSPATATATATSSTVAPSLATVAPNGPTLQGGKRRGMKAVRGVPRGTTLDPASGAPVQMDPQLAPSPPLIGGAHSNHEELAAISSLVELSRKLEGSSPSSSSSSSVTPTSSISPQLMARSFADSNQPSQLRSRMSLAVSKARLSRQFKGNALLVYQF